MEILVTPIFVGSPDVEDVSLSNHEGKKWLNEWSEDVDTHKLLLSVAQRADGDFRKLSGDDLDKVMIRDADSPDGVKGVECGDPLPASARFIGERPADPDSHPTTIWEISSDEDITTDPNQLFTAWIDGEELNQLGTVHVEHEGNDIIASLGNTRLARDDLTYYYANR
ncbi:hypothetical protein [Brevibacterium linens]|uniref:Uncharacterized protein n=1 Tax=Brevibacterium linens ATCC 9172 TaxID=1255617 RepID=A0A2H1KBV7_BRELN|nr:hypothetical protein [Brevibacterium linens]KAB1945435.1 hypothetical protein F8227_13940 [Brevibacterium linens ATCC 9172]SMX97139.1 hypothetical protein BLIN9172_03007 [Brevibacterium linens ATCC 9172]